MASSFDKGKAFEQKVAAVTRRKIDGGAKRNKGSHANWNRRSDIFTNLPLHIEAKDHETLKPKEWFRQAIEAASFSQTPVVVFHSDEEIMAMLRYDDLLNLFVEIADLKAEVEDLSKPRISGVSVTDMPATIDADHFKKTGEFIPVAKTTDDTKLQLEKVSSKQSAARYGMYCRDGHIADDYARCMQKACKFSRGYKAKKEKIK